MRWLICAAYRATPLFVIDRQIDLPNRRSVEMQPADGGICVRSLVAGQMIGSQQNIAIGQA